MYKASDLSTTPRRMPGPVVQLAACPIADPEVVSSIQAQPHTFVEIDHELFLLSLVSYKRRYVHTI